MRTCIASACLALMLISCACAATNRQPYSEAELSRAVKSVRDKYGMPALGVLIQIGDKSPVVAVSGVRKLGEDTPVTRSDLWHIGSTEKSMTATLLATFVEDGTISFDTTLYQIFPEYSEFFTEETKSISVEQLLRHASGLPANPAETAEEFAELAADTDDLTALRKKVLKTAISGKLLFAPGSDFSYSNTGYILAAAVAERVGNEDFETLLKQRVFDPLGIKEFGFGQPGARDGGKLAQPWGHRPSGGRLIPVAPDDQQFINPPLFNSAGNLHISLSDWAKFARDHLKGRKGEGVLLSKALYRRLDAPPGGKSGYSMGWGVLMKDGAPVMLTHNGSDGNWFADIRIYPNSDVILLMASNDGREDGEAKAAFREFRSGFNKRYSPIP